MVAYSCYTSDPRIRRYVSMLVNKNYNVDVIMLREEENIKLKSTENLQFYLFRKRDYKKQEKIRFLFEYILFTLFCGFILIKNHIFGARYNLVHLNNMPNFLLLAAIPLRLLGVPVLLDIHDTMPEIYQEKFSVKPSHWIIRILIYEERYCMRLASYVITSEHTKLERLLTNGLSQDKSLVILNLPDPEIFSKSFIKRESLKNDNEFRLVYHGTLAHRLGIDIAIKAVEKLKDKITNLRFDIIGDGEHRPELINLVNQLDLNKIVHFSPGKVPVEQLPEILAKADAGIVPNRDNIATSLMLPTKLLEYIYMRIPCITVQTKTIKYYIENNMVVNFKFNDTDDLAEKILFLYNNPEKRRETAFNALKFYDKYNFESERRRYLQLVEKFIYQKFELDDKIPAYGRNSFDEYYRQPANFVKLCNSRIISDEQGFFCLDSRAICYGRASLEIPVRKSVSNLYNISKNIRVNDNNCFLPFDLDEVIYNFRNEKYTDDSFSSGKLSLKSIQREIYYFIRNNYLMPLTLRKNIQRYVLRDWHRISFPHWPVDRTVEAIFERILAFILKAGTVDKIPFIWFWPDGFQSCLMMTHDVESTSGRDFCTHLMDIDDSFGIKSAFQIIPEERYEVTEEFLESIRSKGYEICIHGLNHDGYLFHDRERFLERVKEINEYAKRYGAKGFRSPSLYRNQAWYDSFEFSYDMSVPNVGHLDAQRGGCCTVMPYFIGDILELPVTTIQDYTLFYILNNYSIDIWQQQIALILEKHGLISFLIHPDYIINERNCNVYRTLLEYISKIRVNEKIWTALPRDIDEWWRQRSNMKLVEVDGKWHIEGPGKERARAAFAMLDGDKIVYEIDNLIR